MIEWPDRYECGALIIIAVIFFIVLWPFVDRRKAASAFLDFLCRGMR